MFRRLANRHFANWTVGGLNLTFTYWSHLKCTTYVKLELADSRDDTVVNNLTRLDTAVMQRKKITTDYLTSFNWSDLRPVVTRYSWL